MRGYTPEQAGNTDLKDMMPASSYEKVTRKFAELWDCVREGREWQPEVLQLELLRKDGSSFWSESLLSLLQNEDGGAPLLLGVTRDISVRKQVEHELLIAKERAEKSERLKDAFVANISHEIRTPLNIILGYSNVIGEKFLPYAAPGDQRFFESVQRGGERLQRTVDMILNMSRLQAGEFIVKPVDLDIAALVRKITADHQPLAQSKSLRLSYIDACGSAVVRADEYCVSQAISNLLHNAIKFTINGEVCLRVFRNAQGSVCVSCQDTGIGISPEYLPQLFARYSQEEVGYSRPFEGLGLGMALIAEYLMLSHATITVESAKGVGSTFTITFPPTETSTALTQETAPDSGVQLSQTASGPALHVWKRRTVLVVEDDEMTVEYMNIILEDQYDVYAADGVDAAWTLLHAKQIDIILMDISLAGGQTGLDLTREIRNSPLHSDIPIIAVTAHAYDADRRRSLDAGCDDYLRKPISSAALFKSMERLLRH
jgi:PAS domain S-box-containing protein